MMDCKYSSSVIGMGIGGDVIDVVGVGVVVVVAVAVAALVAVAVALVAVGVVAVVAVVAVTVAVAVTVTVAVSTFTVLVAIDESVSDVIVDKLLDKTGGAAIVPCVRNVSKESSRA